MLIISTFKKAVLSGFHSIKHRTVKKVSLFITLKIEVLYISVLGQ